MRPLPKLATFLALSVVALPACQSDPTSAEFRTTVLDVGECQPSQSTSFSMASTNAYFPIALGREWQYSGKEGSTLVELTITVLDSTKVLGNGQTRVTTRIVREVERANGDTIEVSHNFYAENSATGTVCYFGEDVDIFNEDGTVSHDGAWRADVGTNHAGIIMPANPVPGVQFEMEGAEGIAEDQGLITQRTGRVQVKAGTFNQTIRIRESNPLDGSHGFKTFARGVGLIIDGPVALVSCTAPCL